MDHQARNAGHKWSHSKCSLNEIHVDNYWINLSTLPNSKFLCQPVLGALLKNTLAQTTTSSIIVIQLQGLSFCCLCGKSNANSWFTLTDVDVYAWKKDCSANSEASLGRIPLRTNKYSCVEKCPTHWSKCLSLVCGIKLSDNEF
jgi:hypothetical protein